LYFFARGEVWLDLAQERWVVVDGHARDDDDVRVRNAPVWWPSTQPPQKPMKNTREEKRGTQHSIRDGRNENTKKNGGSNSLLNPCLALALLGNCCVSDGW
jgi:hypothetical protein